MLKNTVALVTGGASGLGRATVERWASTSPSQAVALNPPQGCHAIKGGFNILTGWKGSET